MRLFGAEVPAVLNAPLGACRDHFRLAAVLSALVNLLYLAPTLYMMQVYDRAVPTGGTTTLLWLTLLVVCALATLAVLDGLRARVLLRSSLRLDRLLARTILDTAMMQGRGDAAPSALREFDSLRAAIAGPPMIALFDIAWTPVYILVALLVHPAIGALALAAAAALLALSFANERANRAGGRAALLAGAAAFVAQDRVAQRAELLRALGMRRAMATRLMAERDRASHAAAEQQLATGSYGSFAKFLRLALQSLALGLGAWLAIDNLISAGSIIAASVLVSRALQPIELLVSGWAGILQARQAIDTMAIKLAHSAEPDGDAPRFALPAPKGFIEVRQADVLAPGTSDRHLLEAISLRAEPGELVGIIGPSGAGKSTLARLLSAALLPDAGQIRIDGSDMGDWDGEQLARHIGYMPQDAGLLPGSVADNISRFAHLRGEAPETINAAVLEAARAAEVHDMIVGLPGGYDLVLGWDADELSVGQRQRIALARALYGKPALLVLDEPNSALDAEGEGALLRAVAAARAGGATVFMVTHRASLLVDASRLVVLVAGRITMTGSHREVTMALQRRAPAGLAAVGAGN